MIFKFLFFALTLCNCHDVPVSSQIDGKIDLESCIQFLSLAPNDIKQEICLHYEDILYCQLLNQYYSIGLFESEFTSPYCLKQYKDMGCHNIQLRHRQKSSYSQLLYSDPRNFNSFPGCRSISEINNNNYFVAGDIIVNFTKPNPHSSFEDIRVDHTFSLKLKPNQFFDNAIIHPTQNVAIIQHAPNYNTLHTGNVFHKYYWSEEKCQGEAIPEEKAFSLQHKPKHLFFLADSTDKLIYFSRFPHEFDDYQHYIITLHAISSGNSEQLGIMQKSMIDDYLKDKKNRKIPTNFAGIRFTPKPDHAYFNLLLLACLTYQWLYESSHDKEIGKNLLTYFGYLPLHNRRKLIWKTTTSSYGNLFKKLHDTLKYNK